MKFSIVSPRVALADSLTRGYFLKPLRGFGDGVRNTRSIEPARALAAEAFDLDSGPLRLPSFPSDA